MRGAVGRDKRNDDNKKLTRVVSTKLSIEYYNELHIITNRVYRNKGLFHRKWVALFLSHIYREPSCLCRKPTNLDCIIYYDYNNQ